MLSEDKLAFQRLSILQLGEASGNVSQACRQGGSHRRFLRVAGLAHKPPAHSDPDGVGPAKGTGRVNMPPSRITFKEAERVKEEKKQPGLFD